MPRFPIGVVLALGLQVAAVAAEPPEPGDAAKGMAGAWEISNAARDKTCAVTFSLDPATDGFKLALDAGCSVFPSLKDVAVWTMGPGDTVRLLDSKSAVILEFSEVEFRMYEAERKGVGLFFMRTQDAIKADTVTPDQLFGEWTLLQEMEKPLCQLTLSNAAEGESYKLTVKPGCDAAIADVGLTTWRIDSNELLLLGRGGSWRFSESDTTTWERIPPSTDPMVLMRQ
jgi:hypothetical protein